MDLGSFGVGLDTNERIERDNRKLRNNEDTERSQKFIQGCRLVTVVGMKRRTTKAELSLKSRGVY